MGKYSIKPEDVMNENATLEDLLCYRNTLLQRRFHYTKRLEQLKMNREKTGRRDLTKGEILDRLMQVNQLMPHLNELIKQKRQLNSL